MNATTIQWYNENKLRRYPFDDTGTLVSDNGQQFPDSLIVDASFTLPEVHKDIYCSFIKISSNLITLGFVSSTAPLLVGTFNKVDIKPYVAYPLTAMTSNVSGWVVFGDINIPAGTYQFSSAGQGRLLQRVVNCIEVPKVTSIVKLGYPVSTGLDKLIRLKAGSGVTIRKHESLPNTIVIALQDPLSFVGPCNDLTDIGSNQVSVHSINKVRPDENGVITIRFT